MLSRKLFCMQFGVGKDVCKRRQFGVRNCNTAVPGLPSKDRCDHVWGQRGTAQFKHFCFEIRKSVSGRLVPSLQVMPEDTENTLADKVVCIIFVACDVWWLIR